MQSERPAAERPARERPRRWRPSGRMGWLVAVVIVGSSLLGAGCSNDNAILVGPTPAGVSTLPDGQTSSDGPSTTASTVAPQGPAAADVVVALEMKVRRAAGGCWESFAPGAPSAVARQDLWFASTALCSGNSWSVALQVFGDDASLNAASRVPTTAALLHDGRVLVVIAPSAAPTVRALLANQPGVSAVRQAA